MSDLQTVEAEVGASSPPMSNMYQPSGLHVMEVNPYLTCVLCGGYFIDATTITECLHSFCKTCIVRYLKSSKFCPICDVQVHKTRPLVNIRADKTLQDIVYKLVPGLFRNEMKRRREFYSAHPKEAAHVTCQEDRGDLTEQRVIYSPDDIISLSLEYGYGNNQLPTTFHSDDKTDSRRRFLQCPAAVTVLHLKKFIIMKYNLSQTYLVSIMYYDEVLQDNYKLMDIAYIYTWKRNEPMRLFYRITDNHKKIPSTSNSTCFQTSAGVGVSETMTGSRPLLSRETSEINTNRTDPSPAQKREKRRKPPVETRLSLKKKKRTFKNKKKRNNSIDSFHKPSEVRSPSVTGLLEDDRNVRTSNSDSQKKSSKQSFPEAPLKFPVKNGNDPEKEYSKNKMAKRSHALMETFSKPEKKTVLKQKVAFQKSEKRVGPVLPQKTASELEINNNTNAVESKKLCSSFGNNKVSFSESTNTEQFVERGKPTIPFRSRKPANTADSKRNTSQVSSVKNAKVAEIKHISNSSDTKNPSCQAETKKVSIITESKKLVHQNETKTRKNSSESSALATLIESRKPVSRTATVKHANPDKTKRLSSQREMNDISSTVESKNPFSQNNEKTGENSNESNKHVTTVENKQFVNRTAPMKSVKPDEAMKLSILIEVNSVSTTPESKKLVNERKTSVHANPSEANTTLVDSVERENPVSRTETTEHTNPDETQEHDSQTNIRELCNQTQTRELVASPEVRTLNLDGASKSNSEFPTIRTTSVRTAYSPSAPSLSSSEFITSGTRQDTDPTLATSAGNVDRKVGQNPLLLLSGENTGVSRQLAIIEKKSRRDSELKVTKSPEFFVSKPGEIPPLKISRKLSIQVVDPDKLDHKTCSGLGPETQLNSGDKLRGLDPVILSNSEDKLNGLSPETQLNSGGKLSGLGSETKLNSGNKLSGLGSETKLSSEAKVTGLGPETKLNSEDKVRGLNSDIELNSEDKLSGLSPETQLNNLDKFRAPVFANTTPKRQKSPVSTPCFTTTVRQPSSNGVLHLSPTMGYPSCPTPLRVPSALPKIYPSPRENFELPRDDIGALDLSLTHRQEVVHHNQPNKSSSRHVANPPVLEKLCRPPLCLSGPAKLPLKMSPPPVPHGHTYSRKVDSGRNHRYKSGTLTVITSDPNSYRPKIVIKNLDPRPDHGRHQYSHRT